MRKTVDFGIFVRCVMSFRPSAPVAESSSRIRKVLFTTGTMYLSVGCARSFFGRFTGTDPQGSIRCLIILVSLLNQRFCSWQDVLIYFLAFRGKQGGRMYGEIVRWYKVFR